MQNIVHGLLSWSDACDQGTGHSKRMTCGKDQKAVLDDIIAAAVSGMCTITSLAGEAGYMSSIGRESHSLSSMEKHGDLD